MSAMLKKFQKQVDALSERERGILFAVVIALALFAVQTWIIDPQLKKQASTKAQLQLNQKQIAELQSEMNSRLEKMGIDPDAAVKERIADARQSLQKMDEDLGGFQKNLVNSERMGALLEGILKRNQRLQLISLKSLPVVNLMALPTADDQHKKAIDEQSIYKHEVELVLTGNYLDMLAYMRELEAMPERLYWGGSQLTVIEYPKARLSLNLFTLSLEKTWLNL